MNMKVGEILSTDEYDLFELAPFHRDVGKINDLIVLMKQYGYLPEYHINLEAMGNGKLSIREGQRRFAAAKKLGINVCYMVVDPGGLSIAEIETSRKN